MMRMTSWAIAGLLFTVNLSAQEPANRVELREKTEKQLAAIADALDGVMGYVVVDIASGERFERMAQGIDGAAS